MAIVSEHVWVMLLTALAGGVGAAIRYLLDSAIILRAARRVRGSSFPYGTFIVNVSGSLLIGLLAGVFVGLPDGASEVSHQVSVVLGVGLLGGYTTFSSASYETVRLLQHGRVGAGLVHGVGQLVLTVASAGLGFAVGSFFSF